MPTTSSLPSSARTGSDILGRYYTHEDISDFLADRLSTLAPRKLLDLGVGNGALSLAALTKWRVTELVTVDIDKSVRRQLGRQLKSKHPELKHEHVSADALSVTLPDRVGGDERNIDACVCNPPFITPKWRKGFGEILEDVGFSGCLPALREVDAALLFLAQNLRLANSVGTVGIILPDSLISASRYRDFRKELLTRYHVDQVVRLPRQSFCNTDALAHILVVSKGKAISSEIPLYSLNNEHHLGRRLSVDVESAIERLDYAYHAHKLSKPKDRGQPTTLASIGADIKRGSYTSSGRHGAPFPVFHITNITRTHYGKWCDLKAFGAKEHQTNDRTLTEAIAGDILLARVGRNLETKVIGVESGYAVLTDCVLRLRVPKAFRQRVLDQLASNYGRAWLASHAYGVGAQQISKADLLKFPLSA